MIPWVVALCAVLAAAAVIGYDRYRVRRTMDTLDHMLDEAIDGAFTATHFDESRLSAVEAKMQRYLEASGTTKAQLAEQKAHIQELIADVSHQTKTPIANILLYAELLDDKPLPEDCRDCVQALSAQAEKLRFLIASLVKAGRLETGVIAVHPKQDSVAALVQDALREVAPKAAAKGITLSGMPADETACFDRKWTLEALGNLLDNAVKYTPAGGSVTVSVVPYELFCRIDVTDTGIGLTEEESSRVFARFYRAPTAQNAPGVGLGLYLAREIAAANGGYIKVSSHSGAGSTFSLFLPRGERQM
ncbi:sensor histidine kinase [Agathobaculum sp. Marseille-P7918]|uniref:sensor histidine kinase n=1 Tax=Agathobaculum sp. Marseille-P7918 TaxID=2479843 RepID=UPI00356B533D